MDFCHRYGFILRKATVEGRVFYKKIYFCRTPPSGCFQTYSEHRQISKIECFVKIVNYMFQPSRFEWETPVLKSCLPSYRLISKSPVLREICPNFQFFVKIPISVSGYFVFWCFNCVTAIGDAKNTLQIHANSLFLQWFIVGFPKYVLKNGKIIILLN